MILTMVAAATLAGHRSVRSVADFVADLPCEALARLGARQDRRTGRGIPPSEATIRRTVNDINADEADALIGDWLFEQVRAGRLAAEEAPAFIGLAGHGKTLNGAWPEVNTATGKVRLFSALVHGQGVIVGQRAIPANTREVTQVLPLLDTIAATAAEPTNRGSGGSEHQAGEPDPLDLGGVVITADALHVHRDNIEGGLERGGQYVLTVKSNQPTLPTKLTELFGDSDGAFPLTTSPLTAGTAAARPATSPAPQTPSTSASPASCRPSASAA